MTSFDDFSIRELPLQPLVVYVTSTTGFKICYFIEEDESVLKTLFSYIKSYAILSFGFTRYVSKYINILVHNAFFCLVWIDGHMLAMIKGISCIN